jgi:hypothetical protein
LPYSSPVNALPGRNDYGNRNCHVNSYFYYEFEREKITTISVWFFDEQTSEKVICPMVMVNRGDKKRKYHYHVTVASLKRIDKIVRNIKSEYTLLVYNGWSIDFKEKK